MLHIHDRLQVLSYLQIGTTLIAGRKRCVPNSAEYFAALVLDGENVAGVHAALSENTNYESEVEKNPWMPMAFGATPQEAFEKLDERLKNTVLSSATMSKWMGDVISVERFLSETKCPHALAGCDFTTIAQEG